MSYRSLLQAGAIRRRGALGLAAVASAALLPLAAAAPAGASTSAGSAAVAPTAASACATAWGTGLKGTRPAALSRTTLTNVRAGQHPCFDRIVIDLSGQLSHKGFNVGYVSQVTQDGSGRVVPLRGKAKLQVVVGAPAYDSKGRPTYKPRNQAELVRASSLKAVRQVAWAGSFEGQTTIGIGVDKRRAFRAFVLDSPSQPDRLVIDIANR